MHEALRSPQYIEARNLLKAGQPCTLLNQYGERKTIDPSKHTRRDLMDYFKIAHDLDEPITQVEAWKAGEFFWSIEDPNGDVWGYDHTAFYDEACKSAEATFGPGCKVYL